MGVLGETIFIAEAKDRSPHDRDWRPAESYDERLELACEYGDWVSIHTNPWWGGSFRRLEEARELTNKPILAKGIHASDKLIQRALDCGADYVLTVGFRPSEEYLGFCLVEPLTVFDLKSIDADTRAVWNSRNPLNGDDKIDNFELARQAWPKGWLCQASNIRTLADVHPDADAVLVGTNLPGFMRSLST